MKKLLALSITYFSFLGVYAQNLDLSKFALPEYKRNELQFSLAGNNSSGNTNNFDKDGNDQGNSYNYNTNNNFNGNLYSFHNSERFQGVFRTGYAVQSPQVNNNKMENLNLTQSNKSRSNYYNYYVSSTNRFYFPSKWFIEADPQMSINYYNYNYRTVYSFNDPNLNSIS
ncbi:MAG: hypothetical protein H6539_08305, partial [Bacteroidales bacterium]|nr:hypothetical protein [Bacteroidales bacterium]